MAHNMLCWHTLSLSLSLSGAFSVDYVNVSISWNRSLDSRS